MSSCQNEQFDYPGRDEDLKRSLHYVGNGRHALRMHPETTHGDMPTKNTVHLGTPEHNEAFASLHRRLNSKKEAPTPVFKNFAISILKMLRDRVDNLVMSLIVWLER